MKENIIYISLFFFNLGIIPFLGTILKKIEAVFSGKKGPRLLQGYYDLAKLLKKEDFKSEFTSLISFISPIIILTISILFLFFIPIFFSSNSFDINIIVLFDMLGISAFFLILYGIDNATYFGGLGASRESFTLSISEPITILLITGFIVLSNGQMNLSGISNFFANNNDLGMGIISSIFAITLFFIFLAENKRFPFDNPGTHLELTMIHEAMLLETSGKTLFILELASKILMFAFINLFILLFWNNLYGLTNIFFIVGLWFIKVLILLLFIGIFEVLITKLRLFKYQNIFLFLLVILFLSSIFYFIK